MRKITVLLGFAALAFAQEAQQKQEPPAGGTPKPFNVPATQATTLGNGLRVTLAPYGNMPMATVNAVIRAGNLNEAAKQVNLADVLGDLLKEGAAGRNAEALAQEAARMGGQLSVNVGPDQTQVSIDVLSEFAPDAVRLIADVLQRPDLPESELPRLKKNLLRTIAVARSEAQALADEAFRKALYGDHPYGRTFATEEMVGAWTIDDVRAFYKANFGAARTHVYVSGKFDPAVLKAVTEAFAKWERGPDPLINVPKPEPKPTVVLIDRPDAPQSTLRIGLPTLDPKNPDYIPMVVTNALLGGSFASRITQNIREQKGYTYSPFSQLSVRYRDGYWAENADVTTAVTGPAIQEILGEIKRLRQEAPPAPELKGIQNYLAGTFVLQNSSPRGIIGQLAFVNLHDLGSEYLKTYVQRVHGVTGAEVQRVTEKYLDPDKMTLVVVGDKAKIADQVAQFDKKK
ncbi:MAG TPA: pitrilysin family protein [Bryobacteraceae bacterium]|nr:pitrilysin family protein [Bryobacteraceae bacterium]